MPAALNLTGQRFGRRDCRMALMRRPEQEIQKAVVKHLQQRGAPGVVYWHTPNGVKGRGRRFAIQGAIARGMGARAGVSDLVVLHRGKFFALELKAPKQNPTEEQLKFLADVRDQGGFTCVAEGLDAAIKTLEAWGVLRGKAA